MIKNIFVITVATTTSLYAMEQSHAIDIPSHEIIPYLNCRENNSYIKKEQRKRKLLIEKLEDKPEIFTMWNPEDNAISSLYTANNKNNILTILDSCQPTFRIGEHSILSSIMLCPNISSQEKKEIIAILLSQNYIPTEADKKLNALETYERCKEKENKNPISLITFNTESLL